MSNTSAKLHGLPNYQLNILANQYAGTEGVDYCGDLDAAWGLRDKTDKVLVVEIGSDIARAIVLAYLEVCGHE